MAEPTEVEWQPTCKQAECIGIRLPSARMCLAHASEKETAAALKLIGETGEIEARGVPITPALLERILTAAPCGENAEPLIKGCRFDRATFSGDVRFADATFTGDAGFVSATFSGDAWFADATFSGGAWFAGATFSRDVRFADATFIGDAGFGGATFRGDAEFADVTFTGKAGFGGAAFTGDARFDGAIFSRDARFDGATFSRDARFDGATFSRDAGFDGATFSGDARFGGAAFTGDARFDDARFEQARQFGPLLAYRVLVLDNVKFEQPVQIEVSSTGVCCRGARFGGGVQFRLRWARVVLDDADLAAPSILAGIPRLSSEELARPEEQISEFWQPLLAGGISARPQLLSLRRADVAGLVLSNVSAADCRFDGALNLDKLRLESGVSFAAAPSPVGLGWRKWGGREVIAEERAWRADRSRRRWVAPRWPGWLDDQRPGVLDPGADRRAIPGAAQGTRGC